jgi:hypothetical protein
MDLDEIFTRSYLNEFNEKEKKKIQTSQEDRLIASKKRKQLEPIKKFLQRFVDLEVSVHHRDQYTKNTSTSADAQKFSFEEIDSSKAWSPGVSLLFNHPAEVEIAVPNRQSEEGAIIIKVVTHHPDAFILEQKFSNVESACEALARFLGKCTVSIGRDPKLLSKKVPNNTFLNNAPTELPENPGKNLKKINNLFNEEES